MHLNRECIKSIVRLLPIHSLELHTIASACTWIKDYICELYPDEEENAFRLWSPVLMAKSPRLLSCFDELPKFNSNIASAFLHGLIERRDEKVFSIVLENIPYSVLKDAISTRLFEKAIVLKQLNMFRQLAATDAQELHNDTYFNTNWYCKALVGFDEWQEYEWVSEQKFFKSMVVVGDRNRLEKELISVACKIGNIAIFEKLMDIHGRNLVYRNCHAVQGITSALAMTRNLDMIKSYLKYFDLNKFDRKLELFATNLAYGCKSIAQYLKSNVFTSEEFASFISDPSYLSDIAHNDDPEMVEWYIDNCHIDCIPNLLRQTLLKGNLNVVKMILSKTRLPLPELTPKDSHEVFSNMFYKNESKDTFEWLIENKITSDNDTMVSHAVDSKIIEIVEYIAENDFYIPESTISLCIMDNQFEYLVLFYEHSKFAPTLKMFELAVQYERLQIMKWFDKLGCSVFDTPIVTAAMDNMTSLKSQVVARWLRKMNPCTLLQ